MLKNAQEIALRPSRNLPHWKTVIPDSSPKRLLAGFRGSERPHIGKAVRNSSEAFGATATCHLASGQGQLWRIPEGLCSCRSSGRFPNQDISGDTQPFYVASGTFRLYPSGRLRRRPTAAPICRFDAPSTAREFRKFPVPLAEQVLTRRLAVSPRRSSPEGTSLSARAAHRDNACES
jgi:hypothetical protein